MNEAFDTCSRDRAERDATSGAIPCVVTAVNLSSEPQVTVKPLIAIPYDTFNGEVVTPEPLEIAEVPYVFPRSASFAVFLPPSVGQRGFLVVTQTEIGEIETGVAQTSRRRDARSGYFIPGGDTAGAFEGNAEWAELRSKDCRIALSGDTVHLEAGNTSFTLKNGQFDISVNGVSLLSALKQMSAHIKKLEELVHPNGFVHGPVNVRQIDSFTAAATPSRNEQGV